MSSPVGPPGAPAGGCCGSCTNTLGTLTGYSGCALPVSYGLTGITSPGGGVITVTATSSNVGIIPNPTVTYTSPNTTGTVNLAPVGGAGTATISVTVSSTACAPVTKTFTVSFAATFGPPTLGNNTDWFVGVGSGPHVVNLTGIGYGPGIVAGGMTVVAISSNPGLVPNPPVTYTSPNATGTLTFTDTGGVPGVAIISITVTDNALVGLGPAGCITPSITKTFKVTVS